jgi:molybdate transport system ATP-binding protein
VLDWIAVARRNYVLVRVQVGSEQLMARRITRYSFDHLKIQRDIVITLGSGQNRLAC